MTKSQGGVATVIFTIKSMKFNVCKWSFKTALRSTKLLFKVAQFT